jgi:hypothetical protein
MLGFSSGIVAKCRIAELLDIEFNSVILKRESERQDE